MMGAVSKWMSGAALGLAVCGLASAASAADLTDDDRSYGNFTREAATINERQIRLEVRGMSLNDEGTTRLDFVGRRIKADSIHGGRIETLASFGIWQGSEVGLIIPVVIESLTPIGASEAENREGLGDISLYWKFAKEVAEGLKAGAGVEVQTPSNTNDHLGTREVGLNPFVGARYSYKAIGFGINTGYQFYSGDVANVYNFGGVLHLKGGENWALRTEVVGRIFDQAGLRNHDIFVMPGVDYNISNNVLFRPTGMAGCTDTALDWGVGAGISATF